MMTPSDYVLRMARAYLANPEAGPSSYTVRVTSPEEFEFTIHHPEVPGLLNRVRRANDVLVDEWTEDGEEWTECARAPDLPSLADRAVLAFTTE